MNQILISSSTFPAKRNITKHAWITFILLNVLKRAAPPLGMKKIFKKLIGIDDKGATRSQLNIFQREAGESIGERERENANAMQRRWNRGRLTSKESQGKLLLENEIRLNRNETRRDGVSLGFSRHSLRHSLAAQDVFLFSLQTL